MRALMMTAVLLAATAAAAPAAAQNYGNDFNNGAPIERRLERIDNRISTAVQRNRISQREAQRLGRELDVVDNLYDRYRRNGLTQWENRDLQNRVNILRQRVAYVIREDNRRAGPGRDDRAGYVDHDQYGRDDDDRYDDDD